MSFRSYSLGWWSTLFLSGLAILFVILSSIVGDPANQDLALVTKLREISEQSGILRIMELVARFAQNDAIYTITVGILFTLASTAVIYIFKIASIRSVSIQAITYGYFENFLIRLIQHCTKTYKSYRIVIVMPSFQLVEYPDVYMNEIRTTLENLGFDWKLEKSDDSFGRNAFFVQRRDNPPLPLFIDVPTTLKTLRKILELEADMPAGKVVAHRWWRNRFDALCREFQIALSQVSPPA